MARREKLKEAGLDYYNHNLDTDKSSTARSSRLIPTMIVSIRWIRCAARVSMSARVASSAWANHRKNRAGLIVQLANLPKPPESVPINNLVPIPGTPLADNPRLDPFEFVRTIAAARISCRPPGFACRPAARR